MKVLSLFSGIGAFEKALTNLGIEYDLAGYCEIDKYASRSFAAIHSISEEKNLGDITKINTEEIPTNIDLLTYGFPCQDISVAGKQKGFTDQAGETTRSGLFFEALRIIEKTKPKIAIAENVKNLISQKFKNEFDIVLDSLDKAGYNNYWQVLNAKDYSVPQNRERVFIVSVRKDIDWAPGLFSFPEPEPLTKRLIDVLETQVDAKFYITKYDNIRKVNDNYFMLEGGTIGKMHDISRRVYNPDYIAPTIHCCGGGNLEPKILEPTAAAIRGRYLETGQSVQQLEISNRTLSNAVTTVQKDSLVFNPEERRVRKLTPKECFRLMGFSDADFEKAQSCNSNTQLYKQAGNSIVVPVLEKLFNKILNVFDIESDKGDDWMN